jgi:hypothetical protein
VLPEDFHCDRALPGYDIRIIKVSYSKDYKKEAGILKIDLFSTLKKSPNRWRYSRYEEA